MSNFCITAIVPFLEYILLYGAVVEYIKLIWKNKRGLLSALCHLKEGVKLEEYVYRLLEIRHTNTIKEEILSA